jgi:hypothetical protein
MILTGTIDVLLFKNAEEVGEIRWGRTPARSQYALVVVTVAVVQLMCLMGFIRSGLRGDWHIFGVMRDTSEWAYTPSNFVMTQQVGGAVLLFMIGCAFMFWLGGIASKKSED